MDIKLYCKGYLRDAVEQVIQRRYEDARAYALRFEEALTKPYTKQQLEALLTQLIFFSFCQRPKRRSCETTYSSPYNLRRERVEEPMEIGAVGPAADPRVTRWLINFT